MEQSKLTVDVIEALNLPPYPTLSDLVVAVEKKYGKSLVFEEGSAESLGRVSPVTGLTLPVMASFVTFGAPRPGAFTLCCTN